LNKYALSPFKGNQACLV